MAGPNPFNKGGTATKAGPTTKGNGKAVVDDDNAPDISLSASPPVLTDPFSVPSLSTCPYKVEELVGELLLFRPSEVDSMFTSSSKPGEGPSPFVRCEVWRVENDYEYIEDMLFFQKLLVASLKKTLRGPNALSLGRLYLGDKKSSKNPPYMLAEATPKETETVLGWCNANDISLTEKPTV